MPDLKIKGIGFNLKGEEKILWAEPCIRVEKRNITKKVNYSGFTASVKIAPGFRYRAGSVGVGFVKEEHILPKDVGFIWVSNMRIGFEGKNGSIQVSLDRLHAIDLPFSDVIQVRKEGREKPYIFKVEKDAEVIAESVRFALEAPDPDGEVVCA